MNTICPMFTKDISSPVTCLNEKCSFYNEETDNCSVNDLSVMYSHSGDGTEKRKKYTAGRNTVQTGWKT